MLVAIGHLFGNKCRIILLFFSPHNLNWVVSACCFDSPSDHDLTRVQFQVRDFSILPGLPDGSEFHDLWELLRYFDRQSLYVAEKEVSQLFTSQQVIE